MEGSWKLSDERRCNLGKRASKQREMIGFIGDVQVELGRCIGTLQGIANALDQLAPEGHVSATTGACAMLARQRAQSANDVMKIYEALLEE
jgi:hypothetical protein